MHNLQKKEKTLFRLLRYLGAQKKRLALVIVLIILMTAIGLVAPLVLGYAIDEIALEIKNAVISESIKNISINSFMGWLILLVGLYLLIFILNYIERYIMSNVSEGVALSMRKDLSDKLNSLPLSFYDGMQRGDILSRATSDIEKVSDTFREGLSQLFTTVITIVGAIGLMFYIYPRLALVAVSVVILTIIVTVFIAQRTRVRYANYQKKLGELNGNIEEVFTGQLIVKAFNQEPQTLEKFEKLNQDLYKTSYKSQIATFLVPPVAQIISGLGYAAVALISGYSVIQGRLTIGMVQAFIQYLYKSSEPIIESAYIANAMQSAIASSKRLFEVMDQLDHHQEAVTEKLNEAKGEVAFNHVVFGYSPEKILMKDVSFKVNIGEKVAIVGPTGAGKTTLVNLLMRFYEIQGGSITVDGIDTRKLSLSNLRENFGMVLQDTWLFKGTIRDNIAYSNLNISDEKVIRAAKAARADHFITTLPHGYKTIIDEDGTNISQGQKQLLTIARVILADPAILILDEATSSVDTRTEVEIQKAMKNLMKGRTSFVIAHRLSTIRDADLILVMNNGSIIEQGTHDQLIEDRDFYSDLYYSQFEQTAESEE